jgi:hypothetical protein
MHIEKALIKGCNTYDIFDIEDNAGDLRRDHDEIPSRWRRDSASPTLRATVPIPHESRRNRR